MFVVTLFLLSTLFVVVLFLVIFVPFVVSFAVLLISFLDSSTDLPISVLALSVFVVEGEKVEKGQSIGTVGNTAVFEIADEPHLHFEILKDSIQVDPNIYLK